MFEMLICCGGKEWKRLYLELIRPHLEYFVLLWGSWTRKMLTDLSKLSKGPSGWSGRWGRVPQKPRKELLRCHQPPSLHGRRRKDINLIGAHSHWTQKNIFKWRQSSLGTLPGGRAVPVLGGEGGMLEESLQWQCVGRLLPKFIVLLEGTHKDHQIKLLALQRTTWNPNSISKSSVQALLELWHPGAVTLGLTLGSLFHAYPPLWRAFS